MNEVRVLVVDDEPVTRIITDKVLQAQGFTVRSAESAEAAFALLADDFRPDLILLDVVMPGMSGYEACRRLRADARYEHLPIVMLTALDDQKSIDEAYFSGATDFITKPLNMPLLPHRVRHLLRSAMTFQQLMTSRETLLNTQKLAGLGDWTLDSSGALLECSEQFRALLGIGRPPRPASALLARVHPEDRARVEAARAGLRGGAGYEIEYRLVGPDGAVTHLLEVGYPNAPDAPPGAHGYTQDITKRVEVEAQVRRLAWFDPLTGLRNRSRMVELMADEMAISSTGRLASSTCSSSISPACASLPCCLARLARMRCCGPSWSGCGVFWPPMPRPWPGCRTTPSQASVWAATTRPTSC